MTSPRRRATRRAATLALALAIPAIAASPAAAGTLTIINGQAKYTAAPGEYNDLNVGTDYYETQLEFTDGNALITLGQGAGGCTRYQYADPPETSAYCPGAGVTSLLVELGDKNDAVNVDDAVPLPTRTFFGGLGDDDFDDHNDLGFVTMHGGDGFDDLSAYGTGNDTLNGDAGDDRLYSADGASKLNGGLGDDSLSAANDIEDKSILHGNEGHDQLSSGVGDDELWGDTGDDNLSGYQGSDLLNGGAGNDTLDGDYDKRPMADTFVGGEGVDTVNYGGRSLSGSAVNVNLDGLANDGASGEMDKVGADIENITGTWKDDVLTGNGQANEIHGLYGDDVITGAGGSDDVNGNSDDDQVSGGTGDDRVEGDDGYDVLDGGDGNDDMFGGEGDDDMFGADGHDKIRSEGDFDEVDGGPGLDNIDAGAGSDTVRSRDDVQDQVACSGGADLAYIDIADVLDGACAYVKVAPGASVDRAMNRITFTAGPAGAASLSTMSVTVANGVLTFKNSASDVAVGSGCTRGADSKTVNCPVTNAAFGGAVSAITIDGNDGADTLTQAAAIQTRFVGGPGNDKIGDSPATDSMFGNDGADLFTQSATVSPDTVWGGDDRDHITYNARTAKVAVNLDSIRNDGADPNGDTSGEEGDYIRTDVEDVTGGLGADWLRGSSIGNTLNGNLGADLLSGGLGPDTLNGQGGADVINSRDGNPDTITCGTEGGQLTKDAAGDVTPTGHNCTIVAR